MNMFPITPTTYCVSQGQNAICIISMPHIKRKWAVQDESLHQKRSVSNPRKSDLHTVHFFLHLHLFDKAVSSDGKNGDMVLLLSDRPSALSINDIICPPDISACHSGGKKAGKRNVYFSPLGPSGWTLQSETLGTVCPTPDKDDHSELHYNKLHKAACSCSRWTK